MSAIGATNGLNWHPLQEESEPSVPNPDIKAPPAVIVEIPEDSTDAKTQKTAGASLGAQKNQSKMNYYFAALAGLALIGLIIVSYQQMKLWDPIDYKPPLEAEFGPEFFRFDPSDLRKKVALLMTRIDPVRAFQLKNQLSLLTSLNEKFDLAFDQAEGAEEICQKLRALGSTLTGLILFYHGHETRVGNLQLFDPIPSDCMDMNPEGTVALHSCSTGSPEAYYNGNPSPNIAEYLASDHGFNRSLEAATDLVNGNFVGDRSTPDHLSLQFNNTKCTTDECYSTGDMTVRFTPTEASKKVDKYLKDHPPGFLSELGF